MTRRKIKPFVEVVEVVPGSSPGVVRCGYDGHDLYIEFDGVRIAKRGNPGTPYHRRWISLEPGFTVLDNGPDEVAIHYHQPNMQ
jgi:hypothetical protein